MILKNIFFSILLSILCFTLAAQNNTNSPYSGFGIGELEYSYGGRNIGMGRTGIALRSNVFINTTNPASLTELDQKGFLLDMGVNFEYTKLKSSTKAVEVFGGNLNWVQMAFPISKKLFCGFSVNPKSSVGYSIYTEKGIEGTASNFNSIYEGSGGLSEVSGLFAWKLSKNISLGGKVGYLWGNVTQTIDQNIPVSMINYNIVQVNNTHYSGSYFNLGTQIIVPVSSKSSLVFGSIAGISGQLKSKTSTSITKTYSSSTNISSNDSYKLPLDYGVGASYIYGSKWVGTFDYEQSNWEEATLAFSSNKLSTNRGYRGGIEYSPKNRRDGMYQFAKYRLGYRYDTGYLVIYNYQIHEKAISFGVGLPIRKGKSFANLSVELGIHGTLSTYLIEEKFVKLNCSFNLWDNWFVKREFD